MGFTYVLVPNSYTKWHLLKSMQQILHLEKHFFDVTLAICEGSVDSMTGKSTSTVASARWWTQSASSDQPWRAPLNVANTVQTIHIFSKPSFEITIATKSPVDRSKLRWRCGCRRSRPFQTSPRTFSSTFTYRKCGSIRHWVCFIYVF